MLLICCCSIFCNADQGLKEIKCQGHGQTHQGEAANLRHGDSSGYRECPARRKCQG
jgi:hypothetical protein